MTLKEIKSKIHKGDFANLAKLGRHRKMIDPAELAKVISALYIDTAIKTFIAIPEKVQAKTFAYFDADLQQQIMKGISKENVAMILNELDSDDRFEFYASLKGVALSSFLQYLTPENQEETYNFLGYPQESVARFINTDFAAVGLDMTIAEANE